MCIAYVFHMVQADNPYHVGGSSDLKSRTRNVFSKD